KEGHTWYFLHGELPGGSAFDMTAGRQLVEKLARFQGELRTAFPQSQVLTRSTLLFSDYASQQARHDVSTLGAVTVVGVLLLVFLV
ncbi:hypothetical protein EF878_21300, partial [Dickeya undicola]